MKKYQTIKRMAAVGAVALTLALGVQTANADTQTTIGADFTTAVGLTSAPVSDMDFGTWVVNVQGGDTITLTLDADIGAAPPDATVGGNTASTVVNTLDSANSGQFTVTAPIATTLEIQGSVTTPFAEPTISLGGLTYTDSNTNDAALPAAYNGSVVDVTVAGVPETIALGGVLTITASPPEARSFGDAIITVGLRY